VTPADVDIEWTQPHAARFKAAMDNDFATPEAVAVLFELAAEVNRGKSPQVAGLLKTLGGVLGLLQSDPKGFLQAGAGLDEASIQQQIVAARQPRKPVTSPRPTAFATNCWPRASCSRIPPVARPGKRPSESFLHDFLPFPASNGSCLLQKLKLPRSPHRPIGTRPAST
jgi:hypothetical protein